MESSDKIDWHPAFVAAMKLELKNYDDALKYIEEYQLTDKPLRIDVIVLNEDRIQIEKKIARIFKKYNIMEYKSPTDYLSIDDFYKVLAYAYLFKGIEGQKNKSTEKIDSVKIEDITVSMVSKAKPMKLLKHLKEHRYDIINEYKGVYYIVNEKIKIQILVQKELEKKENEYLKILTDELAEKESLKQIMLEYDNENKNIAYRILLQVVTSANPNITSEVLSEMRAQLTENNKAILATMVEELNLNKKWEEKGLEKGVDYTIQILKYLRENKSVDEIASLTNVKIEKVREVEQLFKH